MFNLEKKISISEFNLREYYFYSRISDLKSFAANALIII